VYRSSCWASCVDVAGGAFVAAVVDDARVVEVGEEPVRAAWITIAGVCERRGRPGQRARPVAHGSPLRAAIDRHLEADDVDGSAGYRARMQRLSVRRVLALVVVATAVASCGAPAGNPFAGGDGGDSGGGDDGVPDAFAQAFVDAHNAVRAAAQPAPSSPLPPVSWSSDVADTARGWAEGCVFEHSHGALGENLAIFSSLSTTPAEVVDAWASEVADYDYASNRCAAGAQCGHYTQVVWRDSTSIGCAAVACDDVAGFGAGLLFVCNYDPPGNYVGEKPY
jgi:uncharacterized protein YkwD